jgi:hypothetical protein
MMVSPRARNPWSIEIKRDLPEQVFLHMRDAIKEALPHLECQSKHTS